MSFDRTPTSALSNNISSSSTDNESSTPIGASSTGTIVILTRAGSEFRVPSEET